MFPGNSNGIANPMGLRWWDWDEQRIFENLETLTSGSLELMDN